jgi:hypothetical protein
MVSRYVGFIGIFALTFGSYWSLTARFVRKVSRILQVVRYRRERHRRGCWRPCTASTTMSSPSRRKYTA